MGRGLCRETGEGGVLQRSGGADGILAQREEPQGGGSRRRFHVHGSKNRITMAEEADDGVKNNPDPKQEGCERTPLLPPLHRFSELPFGLRDKVDLLKLLIRKHRVAQLNQVEPVAHIVLYLHVDRGGRVYPVALAAALRLRCRGCGA